MNSSVRDQCRSAGDALRAGQRAEAQTAAEAAVALAFGEGAATLEARAQALLTRAWVAAMTGTGDRGVADCQGVLALLAPSVEDHPEVVAPEVLIHLLTGVARWSVDTGQGALAKTLLARIQALVGRHWGLDHPRYLLFSSAGERGFETMMSGSMGLWHL